MTGDDEGIFGVDAQFLFALKPLDREKQPSYSLQVPSHLLLMQVPHSTITNEVLINLGSGSSSEQYPISLICHSKSQSLKQHKNK